MMVCIRCGEAFYGFEGCPACGGEAEEAFGCEFCGGYFREEEMSDVEGMCEACFCGAMRAIGKLLELHATPAMDRVFQFLKEY